MPSTRWLQVTYHKLDGESVATIRIKTWHPMFWFELWKLLDAPWWQKLYLCPRAVMICMFAPRQQEEL